MRTIAQKFVNISMAGISAVALSLSIGLGVPSGAQADEADAKKLLKSMSDGPVVMD